MGCLYINFPRNKIRIFKIDYHSHLLSIISKSIIITVHSYLVSEPKMDESLEMTNETTTHIINVRVTLKFTNSLMVYLHQ